jgi:hypothetical protein
MVASLGKTYQSFRLHLAGEDKEGCVITREVAKSTIQLGKATKPSLLTKFIIYVNLRYVSGVLHPILLLYIQYNTDAKL